MGESYFEVEFTQDPQHIKEAFRYTFFRHPMGIVLMILLGLSGVGNLLAALHQWLYVGRESADFSMVYYCLIAFLTYYIMYRLKVRNTVKRQLEVCNGQPLQCCMTFYPDMIQVEDSTGSHYSLAYSNIKWSRKTAKLFLIHTKAKLIYFFPKNVFTKGQPEYFLSFLASRGVKVK